MGFSREQGRRPLLWVPGELLLSYAPHTLHIFNWYMYYLAGMPAFATRCKTFATHPGFFQPITIFTILAKVAKVLHSQYIAKVLQRIWTCLRLQKFCNSFEKFCNTFVMHYKSFATHSNALLQIYCNALQKFCNALRMISNRRHHR